jgi:hypothetical protein
MIDGMGILVLALAVLVALLVSPLLAGFTGSKGAI